MNDPEKTANGELPTRMPHTGGHGPAPRATVAIAFVHGRLAGLRHAGRDPAALLRRAQLAPELLGEATARVPVDRYADLYNLTNQVALFSVPMRIGTFEFLCRSV